MRHTHEHSTVSASANAYNELAIFWRRPKRMNSMRNFQNRKIDREKVCMREKDWCHAKSDVFDFLSLNFVRHLFHRPKTQQTCFHLILTASSQFYTNSSPDFFCFFSCELEKSVVVFWTMGNWLHRAKVRPWLHRHHTEHEKLLWIALCIAIYWLGIFFDADLEIRN